MGSDSANVSLLIDIWRSYSHLWHELTVPAKTLLLKPGDWADKCYVIKKGVARMWVDLAEKEINFRFCFEGDIVCDFESFHRQVPSCVAVGIETVEASALRWISKEDFDQVTKERPELYKYILDWAHEKQSIYFQHFLSLLRDKPKDRYRLLLDQQPHVLQRVPLQYIASYLGITPVSLSRIRNQH